MFLSNFHPQDLSLPLSLFLSLVPSRSLSLSSLGLTPRKEKAVVVATLDDTEEAEEIRR